MSFIFIRQSLPVFLQAVFFLLASTYAQAADFSAETEFELRYFNQDKIDSDQSELYPSVAGQLEFFHDWDDDNQRLVVNLFARVDKDEERTHVDARELYWRKSLPEQNIDLYVGNRKVFWGVIESRHLVDIINQTDLVENIDTEQKLGQPMLQATLEKNWGTTNIFIMPFFRDRTFPGKKGRFRPTIPVNTDDPEFESGAERSHIDLAARWGHVIGDLDIGVSYFHGTDRVPVNFITVEEPFNPVTGAGKVSLVPHYGKLKQLSVDAQYTTGPWLLKLEALVRDNLNDYSRAMVSGVEYTLYGVANTAVDVGLIAEYQYDNQRYDPLEKVNDPVLLAVLRGTTTLPGQSVSGFFRQNGKVAFTSADNDLVLGARFAFNDVQSTSVLLLASIDDSNNSRFYSLEAERRLSQNWSAELQARVFSNVDDSDPTSLIEDDDYIDLKITRYFD